VVAVWFDCLLDRTTDHIELNRTCNVAGSVFGKIVETVAARLGGLEPAQHLSQVVW